ncbi:hypothetical protein COUCH_14805 [Couchioplanes caeruleus]|uniref:hypothetical protein n=1 Tax=Couchioplanes caeruleus TaxID=56438 RepID=UPI0020C0EB24|nr:hypothetical protein [Couchioplanes caeruleus]UQU67456.1 hypothetical protein COUCH_14805 [Couchioplanes caeruleus]
MSGHGHGAPPPMPPRRRRHWLALLAAGWAVALLAAAAMSAHTGRATVREQRDVADADTVVDLTVGEIAAAAAATAPLLRISADQITPGCRITPVRDGIELRRTLQFAAGSMNSMTLTGIARALPQRFKAATVTDTAGRIGLRADAGEFVAVDGVVDDDGTVTVTVSSGCRPRAPLTPTPSVDAAAQTSVAPLLTAMTAHPSQLSVAQATCPGGGVVRTVTAQAITDAGDRPALRDALIAPARGAVSIIDRSDVFAYQRGSITVLVQRRDTRLDVSVTASCP